MKYATFALVVALAGCSTTAPVRQKFPEATPALTAKCPDLNKIQGDQVAITELLKVVISNYALYYECSTKVDGWNEWYTEQKKIYENVK
jgi:hypothetical protein